MTIAMILAEKGRNVVTADTTTSLRDAAARLVRHGIGALVIVDDFGSPVGLIAERNIVAAVAAGGAEALDHSVTDYMQTNLSPARDDDSVHEVMEVMTVERRRHIPVMSEGRLTGLISIGDVVKHRLRVIEEEHRSMREYIAHA